ncbi:MAG: hypothetical protein CMI55_01930 [Parcubacteria group bacterium]|jgi:hypothetical protein|nr:hypothetical protein [Parcubacteria group bacterium]|tara:strand:+ start:1056 stop:2321 length:1266 start_codon:yes stop_codon:yes gene_type:complete
MKSTKKLAQLLRTSEKVILNLESKMNRISNKEGIIEKIVRENEHKVRVSLMKLGLGLDKDFYQIKAPDVFEALVEKTSQTDRALAKYFFKLDFSTPAGCRSLLNVTKELTGDSRGFYLKKSKAKQLLKLNPPQQIMSVLGYGSDIDKMLEKEDTFEIFCALRFVEDSQWLNNVFFKPYQDIRKEDFEERKIKMIVLPEKWAGIGKKFLGKKLHHMSHLKELGIVFVIPLAKQNPGETLYLFFMSLHYIHEVNWHAKLFKEYNQEAHFAKKMIEALKVKTTETPLPHGKKMSWRIVPGYLAKKDANDARLAEPHVSSEAWHYTKTALDMQKFAQRFPKTGLDFWQDLGVVADYFPTNTKQEALVSFDLLDNGISFLRGSDFESRQLYHQPEALWNKIFIEYLGEPAIDKLLMDNLDKGYITL